MKTIIHINQHKIKQNRKLVKSEPVITVKNYKSNRYGNSVNIVDKNGDVVARVVYSPNKPLSCGATCWIESELKVEVL